MKSIDTHCHLHHTLKRGAKLSIILSNAEKAGVIAMIDSPVYIENYQHSIRLHNQFPSTIFVSLGVPPAQYHELDIDLMIEKIKEHAEKKEIVAVGEVGLDYYWVKKEAIREKQHEIFGKFIDLANELNLPLVIHSRDAEGDSLIDLVKAETPVVMHSFSGSIDIAVECINRGYYISIPTAVTNRKKHRKLAEKIPLEFLLTETDSPYLSPIPEKKRNEPANVVFAVKEIAKLKEISEEVVANITLENAKKIFKLSIE